MTDYEKLCCFENLYKAHKVARRGKQGKKEVIEFELELGQNLTQISTYYVTHNTPKNLAKHHFP